MHSGRITIEADGIQKRFGRQLLFSNVGFKLNPGDSFYITGPNGSGKSTLLQILAGIQRPTAGSILYMAGVNVIKREDYYENYGFTGPQVNPYDALTAYENLSFSTAGTVDETSINEYLERFDLYRHREKQVRYYSSGMKQRLRLIHALIKDAPVLMLDEPCSNLDSRGRDILYEILGDIKRNKIVVIATNESEDINLCANGIDLEQHLK